MSADGWIALAVLAAAVVAFATDRFRADAVALAVLLALAVSGVVTANEAIAGFADPSVLMIGGLFIVGEALVTTGVATGLGTWLASVGRGSETRLIVLLMVVVGAVGAFMSSTGIVAMFIPVVLGLVAKTGISRSMLMMPLSVAALISGLMTLIATAPNLVVSAALTGRGLEPLGFFELTPIGVAVLIVAVVYMTTIGRKLLDRPEPRPELAEVSADELLAKYQLTGRFRVLRIHAGSALAGRTVAESGIRSRYGVTLIASIRPRGDGFVVRPALSETAMRPGDLIIVVGETDAVETFVAAESLYDTPVGERLRLAARQELGIAEVMLAPDAPLIGKTLRQAGFRKRRGLAVVGIRHAGEVIEGNLIDTPLRFGDLILVVGDWGRIAGLQEHPGEFVVMRLPQEVKFVAPARARAPVAVAILVAMAAVMTFGLLPNVIAVLAAALAVLATGCVPAKGVYRSIGWSTLVLIAGMLPMATALEKTGVTEMMASGLTSVLAGTGPYGMLSVLFLITAAFGLFVSNTATAVLIAPVAISAAQTLGVSTHAFAVTVAVACSCAFATPVSSPVNTLVLEPGRYAFNDFVKVGVPLLLLSLVVTVVMVAALYPLTPNGG
ncbi:MAG TPA: SLC13 family permease [Rhodospirillales bacterium]|nr:SLC13 family permease [Rhodospirillales bacterium]